MYISLNPSSGLKSLKSAVDFIDDLNVRASDMRPFFEGIAPDLAQEIKHEFDYSNPNKWYKISDAWRNIKKSEDKPENIGVYTGSLMHAASEGAIKAYLPTALIWKIAPVESIDFTMQRKIGITSGEWLRSLGRNIVNVILGKARNG